MHCSLVRTRNSSPVASHHAHRNFYQGHVRYGPAQVADLKSYLSALHSVQPHSSMVDSTYFPVVSARGRVDFSAHTGVRLDHVMSFGPQNAGRSLRVLVPSLSSKRAPLLLLLLLPSCLQVENTSSLVCQSREDERHRFAAWRQAWLRPPRVSQPLIGLQTHHQSSRINRCCLKPLSLGMLVTQHYRGNS